ncbi:MAG: nitroreductase family protein [Planctomycetota bacterium]|jgi:nitroreductase
MDVHEAIRSRRTIHSYRTEPLPEGCLERALGAAILAPNHRLTFPWRFTRVGAETRAHLAALAVRLQTEKQGALPAEVVNKIRSKVLDPAELIVVTVVRHEDPFTAREDYAATACAIQNLHLALWAEGVGSKWSTGGPTRHEDGYRILGIDRNVEEIIGFLWAGLPAKVPPCPERPALETFVRTLP